MNRHHWHRRHGARAVFCAVAGVFFLLVAFAAPAESRLNLNFDPDWKFTKVDDTNAIQPSYDDHAWATISAPHTFNDVDTFDHWSLPGHRGEQQQWSGRTWYRKTFTAPESFKGKKVYLEFEGVRQVAEVYLNGQLLGVSKNGFIPFGFDLTPYLHFDAPNVIAVMCDNRFMKDPMPADEMPGEGGVVQPGAKDVSLGELSAKVNATIPDDVDQLQADQIPWNNPHWHPAHGGIYRNVYLHVTDPLHISLPLYSFLQTAGPYIYETNVSEKSATVNFEVPVENGRASDESVTVRAEVFGEGGKPVLSVEKSGEVAAGGNNEFELAGALEHPVFWEPAYPQLYRAVISVRVGGKIVDTSEIPFGIRTVRWDAQTGFFINGHHLKLHGWGQKPTDEWPGLGAAQPDWLHAYTLELMHEAGGNFVRWGHSACGPGLADATDRLGIVVEQPGVDGESDTRGAAWKLRLSAFRDMLIYYRNHPSILIWEGGNQKVSREHVEELHGLVEKYDPHGGRAYTHRRADATTASVMDICEGTEGGREIARLPVFEGEYDREESPRRVWDNYSPPRFGYPEAKGMTYDLTSEQYAVNEVSQYVKKLGAPEHSGGANWLFSDSTSGGRVSCEVARASGEVDGERLPKEAYYVCRAMFRADPQVHIIGHWTYPAGTKKDVFVAANGEAVELFLNGKSLGRGAVSDRYLFTFTNVAWEPGELKAVSYQGGKAVATETLRTAGVPVALRLTPITGPEGLRADGSDVALVDVEAVDAKGERCPTVEQGVDFELSGPATWRGGYDSGKTNTINQTHLDLECGINRVAIRAGRKPGTITLRARSGELKGRVEISSKAFEVTDGFSKEMPEVTEVKLPQDGFDASMADTMPLPAKMQAPTEMVQAGQFTQAFSYSGPAHGVLVERDAQDGKKIYSDSDETFSSLPAALRGGDYVQAANADRNYSAVDLMQLAVKDGATIYVAYDERLSPPEWLTKQFKQSKMEWSVNGQPMKIFQHLAHGDESLTLGANIESAKSESCNMYIVFVNAAPVAQAERADSGKH